MPSDRRRHTTLPQQIATIEEQANNEWVRRIRKGQECMTRKSLKKGCPRLMKMVEDQLQANTRILESKYKPKLPQLYNSVNLRSQRVVPIYARPPLPSELVNDIRSKPSRFQKSVVSDSTQPQST